MRERHNLENEVLFRKRVHEVDCSCLCRVESCKESIACGCDVHGELLHSVRNEGLEDEVDFLFLFLRHNDILEVGEFRIATAGVVEVKSDASVALRCRRVFADDILCDVIDIVAEFLVVHQGVDYYVEGGITLFICFLDEFNLTPLLRLYISEGLGHRLALAFNLPLKSDEHSRTRRIVHREIPRALLVACSGAVVAKSIVERSPRSHLNRCHTRSGDHCKKFVAVGYCHLALKELANDASHRCGLSR